MAGDALQMLALVEENCQKTFCSPSADSFTWPDIFGTSWITKPILLCYLCVAVILLLFFFAFRKPQIVPRGLQNFMESIYDFIDKQIVEPVIGHEGRTFVPYLVTLFTFVFCMNVCEIIPVLQFPVSSKIAYPAFLAVATWVIFNYVGIKRQGFIGYFKGIMLPPGVPIPMLLLLSPLELLSTIIIRPFTLLIRLFANMFAGHSLLIIFFLGTVYLQAQGGIDWAWAFGSFFMGTLMIAFELFIAALQAYIFTILTAVYVAGAIAPEH